MIRTSLKSSKSPNTNPSQKRNTATNQFSISLQEEAAPELQRKLAEYSSDVDEFHVHERQVSG